MFSITNHKGFSITFPNGWTASVQWGPGNYCDNYVAPYNAPEQSSNWESTNAEVAAYPSDGGEWHDFGGDTVAPRLSATEVLEFLSMVAAKPAVTA